MNGLEMMSICRSAPRGSPVVQVHKRLGGRTDEDTRQWGWGRDAL